MQDQQQQMKVRVNNLASSINKKIDDSVKELSNKLDVNDKVSKAVVDDKHKMEEKFD